MGLAQLQDDLPHPLYLTALNLSQPLLSFCLTSNSPISIQKIGDRLIIPEKKNVSPFPSPCLLNLQH